MKTKIVPRLLTLIIAFEMIAAPTLANAQSGLGSTLLNGLQAATQAYTQGLQSQNAGAMDGNLQQQATPQVDKYFNLQKMSQIPGLAQYLSSKNIPVAALNCATLRTTMTEVKFDGCSARPPQVGIDPNYAGQASDAYRKQYEEVAKVYSNYSADSNGPGQAFGLGCMNNAMSILKGFFAERSATLDKLASDIETAGNKFQEDARTDMNAIEEDTAVLDGGDSDLTNAVRSRRPDLFDFSKRFNDPACVAMAPLDSYNKKGKDKGLNSINQFLKDTLSTPSGKYSGESFSSAQASITTDINNLADKVGMQAKLDFATLTSPQGGFGTFMQNLKSNATSSEGIQVNPTMFSNIQTQFNDKNRTLQNEMTLLSSEVGSSGSGAMALINNPDAGGFEEELVSMENGIENNCLKQTFVGTNSITNVLSRIKSNESSNFAMKNASNIKPQLEQIMNNPATSMAKKLQLLQEIDSTQGTRYFLSMDNTYNYSQVDSKNAVSKVNVAASTTSTPSSYFTNMIKNCQAQFKSNNLNNKVTGADAIARLRALRTNYANLRSTMQTNMVTELKRKLLTCNTPAQATNSVAGSCGPSSFDPSRDGFCVAGAADCSAKMKSCNAKTQEFVTQIKTDRSARVNNYKQKADNFRTTLNNMFEAQKQAFLAMGGILNGVFGAAFKAPTGIKTQLPEGDRYLDPLKAMTQGSPDGQLLLEDPIKYATMMKENVAKLQASVEAQQELILGQGSPLMAHIANTKKSYDTVSKDAARLAQDCASGRQFYDQMLAAQAQKATELGEKQAKLCSVYSMGQTNPNGACAANISDMESFDVGSAGALKSYCNLSGNHDENNNQASKNAAEICYDFSGGDSTGNPPSNSDYTKYLTYWCAKRVQECTSEVVTGTGTAATTKKTDCESIKNTATENVTVAFSRHQKDTPDDKIEFPNGPAYCNAGYNALTRGLTAPTGTSNAQPGPAGAIAY